MMLAIRVPRIRTKIWALMIGPLLLAAACTKGSDPPQKAPQLEATEISGKPTNANHAKVLDRTADTIWLDLLRQTDVKVIVSSHFDSESTAEYLADDRVDTKWRPNPPDPAPWIRVELASQAQARFIEVTFSSALAQPVSATVITGEQRTLVNFKDQTTRIALPQNRASALTLEFAGTLDVSFPGIAQLAVLGETSEAALPPATPHAVAQKRWEARGPLAKWRSQGPYKTIESMCESYKKIREALPEVQQKLLTQAPPTSRCEIMRDLTPPGEAPNTTSKAFLGMVEDGVTDEVGYGGALVKLLFVQTKTGWQPANFLVDTDGGAHDTRASVIYVTKVLGSRWENGALLLDVFRRQIISGAYPPDGPFNAAALTRIVCNVTDELVCVEAPIAYGDAEVKEGFWFPYIEGESLDPEAIPQVWNWRRETFLTSSGRLRFGPCLQQSTTDKVPCYAPHLHRLR